MVDISRQTNTLIRSLFPLFQVARARVSRPVGHPYAVTVVEVDPDDIEEGSDEDIRFIRNGESYDPETGLTAYLLSGDEIELIRNQLVPLTDEATTDISMNLFRRFGVLESDTPMRGLSGRGFDEPRPIDLRYWPPG